MLLDAWKICVSSTPQSLKYQVKKHFEWASGLRLSCWVLILMRCRVGRQVRPFMVDPLLPITASKLAVVGGIAGSEAVRIVAGEIGMTLRQADKVATRLRRWTADVWPVEYADYDELVAEHCDALLVVKKAKRADRKRKYIVKPYELPHHVQALAESGLTQSECASILQISRHRIAVTLKTYASERAA
jgi:hypothetical protein